MPNRIRQVVGATRVLASRHRPSTAPVLATQAEATDLESRVTEVESDVGGLSLTVADLASHVDDVEDASIAADAALDTRVDILEAAAASAGQQRLIAPLERRLIQPVSFPSIIIPKRTDVLASSKFNDRADLLAWYEADNPRNQYGSADPSIMTSVNDMGTQGTPSAPLSGTIERWTNMLNGQPAFLWPAGGAPLTQLTLPLKGAMTAFFVVKPVSNATFQNLYQGNALAATTFYWDHTGPRWQVGTTANTANSSYGVGSSPTGWKIVFVFHYNTAGNPQARVIENDVQLYNGAAGGAGAPIPGTAGVPVGVVINMFKAGAALPWASWCAAWGFYGVDKFATIGPLRAYLRQKFNTFN